MAISGTELVIKGRILKTATVKDEVDLDVPDPLAVLAEIKVRSDRRIDIFSFAQRVPEKEPRYSLPMKWESFAVLDFVDHRHWFEKILDDKTRNMIRKAPKKGVDLRSVEFDDNLVRGIVEIYNETPVRQGRKFIHYGKAFDEVKKANATHLERSEFIGAYCGDELIGFVKLAYGDRTGRLEQIISKIAHRDKAPTNALLSEAVKLCEKRMVRYLVYGVWPARESFAQFKKNNGFKEFRLPRYFVPLNGMGRIGLGLGLHIGLKRRIPQSLMIILQDIRERWLGLRR